MRHANLIDPDGDGLVVHGTSMFLFVTVAGEDGTRTAGGFTRAQLDELLDAVAPSTGGTATEPHPLTPDAITDEMVERGRSAYWGPTYGGSVEERVRAILTAALTDPRHAPKEPNDGKTSSSTPSTTRHSPTSRSPTSPTASPRR